MIEVGDLVRYNGPYRRLFSHTYQTGVAVKDRTINDAMLVIRVVQYFYNWKTKRTAIWIRVRLANGQLQDISSIYLRVCSKGKHKKPKYRIKVPVHYHGLVPPPQINKPFGGPLGP